MHWSIAVDFIVVFLLIGVLVYAIILNKQLRKLYARRDEVRGFLQHFSDSLKKIQSNVRQLKDTTASMIFELNEKIQEARALRDEVAFFIEKGDKLSQNLEIQFRNIKNETKNFDTRKKAMLQQPTVVLPLKPQHQTKYQTSPKPDHPLMKKLQNVR